MKHKLICLILCLLLLPSLFLSVGAAEQYVIDNADLMSSSEEAALEEKAQALRQEYGMDVVILTVDSLDGKRPQDYADDYYDYNGYAADGVLFLLSMEERDWYISTKGNAIYALTDYGIQQVGESALPYLKNGDYYGAFDAFLAALPTYFSAYSDGSPIDGYADTSGDYYHGDQEDVVYYEQPQIVEPDLFAEHLVRADEYVDLARSQILGYLACLFGAFRAVEILDAYGEVAQALHE